MLACQLAVRLLHFIGGGVFGDAQDLVVVLLEEVLGAHGPLLVRLSRGRLSLGRRRPVRRHWPAPPVRPRSPQASRSASAPRAGSGRTGRRPPRSSSGPAWSGRPPASRPPT